MEGKYTFKEFYENLENGYQIYYTYVRNRYLIFKTAENCYTQKLLSKAEKIRNLPMQCLHLKE